MDYEFLRDITGVVKVRMSMDHEAIGHWFNEEVKDNLTLLQAHHIAEMVHTAVEANFPLVKHCMVHVNPLSEDSHEACTMLPPDLRPHDQNN